MTQKKGVLFVTATLEVGGSESKVVKIANALSQIGYSVAIAYLNPPDTLVERISPEVEVTCLRRRGKYSIASLRRLLNVMADKYPVVMSVNFYPLLYVIPAIRYFSSTYSESICLINTTDFVDGQWIWGHVYAPFLRRCDQLVYGCTAQQSSWTRKYKLPGGRSTHIYNGVDCDRFAPDATKDFGDESRVRLGIPKDAIVFGSIGRFAPEKNFELLIAAFGRLHASGRPAYLVLVGQGKGRGDLEAAAANHGVLEKTIFPGVLDDVRPAISAMDVFVLPSRAVETFSNAALEAMSMALPVILSNIGGAAEMIEQGEDGFLFENGDLDALTALLFALYDSKDERERIGRAARKSILAKFSFERMLDGYRKLIDARIGSDKPLPPGGDGDC